MIDLLFRISYNVIPLIFAITMHEVAHGWAAKQLGDLTAFKLGRLSLNPLRHVDPVGSILVPFALLWATSGATAFGWAKPVPVRFENLRDPKRGLILVALAGPGANLAMAAFWALLAQALGGGRGEANFWTDWLILSCEAGIWFNVLLMVFNLIPIPPLDGGRVLAGLLPPAAASVLQRIEPLGFIIVLLLVAGPWPVLWYAIEPPVRFFTDFFYSAAGFI